LPVQSFSGPSPLGLTTIFYRLPFSSPPTTRRVMVELVDPTENSVFYRQDCVFIGPLPSNGCTRHKIFLETKETLITVLILYCVIKRKHKQQASEHATVARGQGVRKNRKFLSISQLNNCTFNITWFRAANLVRSSTASLILSKQVA
jgi:hypothetical protein